MFSQARGESYRYVRRFLTDYGLLLLSVVIECAIFEGIAQHRGRPSFLSYNSFVNILNQSAVYGVLSVGMTLVILTGGIDLSVGSLIAFGGVLCALVVRLGAGMAGSVWGWIVIGWIVALAAGLASGCLPVCSSRG